METRKLQQVGGGTYTVSIPKEWAEEHGLEAGIDVHLYTHVDGSIVVRSAERDGGNLATARVHVEGDQPEIVERALRAAHAIGFETVTLTPDEAFSTAQQRTARSVMRTLMGAEVLVTRDDEITVRNLLDTADVSVRQSLVQLQFIALSIHRRATNALAHADADAYDRLCDRDDEADRLLETISRHFNRSLVSMAELDRLGTTRQELFDYYVTARQLERVADQGVTLARVARRLSEPLPDDRAEDLEGYAEDARQVVDQAASAVLGEASVEETGAILDQRDETLADLEAMDRALFYESRDTTSQAVAVGRTLDALVRTTEHGGNVAEVAIRGAIRAESL